MPTTALDTNPPSTETLGYTAETAPRARPPRLQSPVFSTLARFLVGVPFWNSVRGRGSHVPSELSEQSSFAQSAEPNTRRHPAHLEAQAINVSCPPHESSGALKEQQAGHTAGGHSVTHRIMGRASMAELTRLNEMPNSSLRRFKGGENQEWTQATSVTHPGASPAWNKGEMSTSPILEVRNVSWK